MKKNADIVENNEASKGKVPRVLKQLHRAM